MKHDIFEFDPTRMTRVHVKQGATTMQRQTAIYNIARIIYEVAVEERGDPAELIDYITAYPEQ